MTASDLATALAWIFGSSGVLTAIWSIWTTRYKPKIDRQQAEDASERTKADIFATNIESLQKIIEEEREAREHNRAEYERRQSTEEQERKKLKAQLDQLTERVEKAEYRSLISDALVGIAIGHIQRLEDHISEGLPPPPPPRPHEILGLD